MLFFYPLIIDIDKKVLNYLNYLSQRKESHRFSFLLPISTKKLHQVKLLKRKTLLALLQSQQLKGACVESWVTYHVSLWKSGQYYIPKKILYNVTHDSDLQKKRERERKRKRKKKVVAWSINNLFFLAYQQSFYFGRKKDKIDKIWT